MSPGRVAIGFVLCPFVVLFGGLLLEDWARQSLRYGTPMIITGLVVFAILAVLARVLVVRLGAHWRYIPRRMWTALGTYRGPFDDATGLDGCKRFRQSNKGRLSPYPGVRLVLTDVSIEIVGRLGGGGALSIWLRDIQSVDIVCGTYKERGIVITTKDGRRASFAVRPDGRLQKQLKRPGASTTDAPPPSRDAGPAPCVAVGAPRSGQRPSA
jgi:hypothetical protein